MYATNWLDENELNVLDVTQRNIKTMTANATSTLTTSPIARLLVVSDDEEVLKLSTLAASSKSTFSPLHTNTAKRTTNT
jgi:hypothetical protein